MIQCISLSFKGVTFLLVHTGEVLEIQNILKATETCNSFAVQAGGISQTHPSMYISVQITTDLAKLQHISWLLSLLSTAPSSATHCHFLPISLVQRDRSSHTAPHLCGAYRAS